MITRTTSPHDYHFMLIAQITRTTSQLFGLNMPKPLSLEIGSSGNSRDGEAAQGRLMRLPIQTLQGSGRNIVELISDICKPEMAYTLDELTQVLYPASPRRGKYDDTPRQRSPKVRFKAKLPIDFRESSLFVARGREARRGTHSGSE